MGLDITAYSKLKFLKPYNNKEDYPDGTILIWPNSTFQKQADGIKKGFYKWEDDFDFRAGSYSGYNNFRDILSYLALNAVAEEVWASARKYRGKPFVELINFSDCEGVIGSETSKKLAKDFKSSRKAIFKALSELNSIPAVDTIGVDLELDERTKEWFKASYDNWEQAFKLASRKGAVDFH